MYERDRSTHVRDDGTAKIVYEDEEVAAKMANKLWLTTGRPHNHYICAQRPTHWHVGRGVPDIETRRTR